MSGNQYVSDNLREKCYNIILERLNRFVDESPTEIDDETLEDMAFSMEQGVYNKAPITKNYRPRMRSVLANMTYTPNSKLVRKKLYNLEWDPTVYGGMNAKQMYPELHQKIKEEEDKKKELNEYFKNKKLEHDSIFTCGKCKSKKVEHIQVQTRSADEPMTVKACCLMCGNRWRM